MKQNLIWRSMILFLFGMAALSDAHAQAPAEQTRQITVIQDIAPVGLAFGQTLRVTALNPLEAPAPGADGRKFKMLVAPLILLADGRVIAERDEVSLAPGEFHSFDFKRADLPLTGETDTGRLQVRVEIRRRFFPGFISRFPQGDVDNAPVSIELIDDSTGKTAMLLSSKPKEIVVVGSK
jgi:hypothetical protein